MDNKITGPISEYLKAYRTQQKSRVDSDSAKSKKTNRSGDQAKSKAPDSFELSEVAKKLKTSDIGEVRTDKVNKLKEEIKQGSYTVDSGKIAEKMIEETGFDVRI